MRSTLATGAACFTLAALSTVPALGREAPPDPPVSHTPASALSVDRSGGGSSDDGGLETGWAIVLCGGAALAGGAAGFVGGRHRVAAPTA